MELEQYNFSVEENQENSLKDLLLKYLYHWKWFLLSIFVCLGIGRYYIKYQTPLFEVNASILIKDDQKGELSELSAFEDLGLLKKTSNIDNEIEILKSRALMMRVVKELKLNACYFLKERHLEDELYKSTPFSVEFVGGDSLIENTYSSFYILPDSEKGFTLKNSNDEDGEKHAFGEEITNGMGRFKVVKTALFGDWCIGKSIHVTFSPVIAVADNYRSSIQISPVNRSSSVLILTLQDPVIDKAIDVINHLIQQHNEDAIADKNLVSKNTAEFINERISFISNELSSVETEAEDFKSRNKLTDVESEAKLYLQTGSESEMSHLDASTQVQVAKFMNDYINRHDTPDNLIPANIGLTDGGVSSQVNSYNKLVLERNRLLKNAGLKNPIVENLEAQINGLRASIKESLINIQNTLEIKAGEIIKKENQINSKIGNVPKYEREYRTIQRQQQIKEALYLYLLQKREEPTLL